MIGINMFHGKTLNLPAEESYIKLKLNSDSGVEWYNQLNIPQTSKGWQTLFGTITLGCEGIRKQMSSICPLFV